MSVRAYAEINFHITWHTKNSFPFITGKLESDLYAFIKERIITMPNVHFHAIGGIETHVHLAASFQPPFEIERWNGDMKGASSYEFGKQLQWQNGYGIVSFGSRDLDRVCQYIRNQKEHHKRGTIHSRLERITA